MIERYSIKFNDELFKKITNSDMVESFESQYNAAPTKSLPIISIKSSDKLSFIYWGASPEYAKNRSLANRLINLDVFKIKATKYSYISDLSYFEKKSFTLFQPWATDLMPNQIKRFKA